MKTLLLYLQAFLLLAPTVLVQPALAQDSDEEDVFELSPFEVTDRGRRGYRSTSTLAGSRVQTEVKDIVILYNELGATIGGESYKSDPRLSNYDSVRVEFAIGYYHDLEKERREKLETYLATVRDAVARQSEFSFEPGAFMVAQGDRKRGKGPKKSEYTSYVFFALTFSISAETSPFEQARKARQSISALSLDGEYTKLFFGEATAFNTTVANAFYGVANATPAVRPAISVTDLGGAINRLSDQLGKTYPTQEPSVAITLIKPANYLVSDFEIQLNLSEPELLDSVLDTISDELSALPALRLVPGSILALEAGELDSSNTIAARIQLEIHAPIEGQTHAESLVRKIKSIVTRAPLPESVVGIQVGETRLVLESPKPFRAELIAALQQDTQNLDTALGDDFSVELQITNTAPFVRQHSSTEVEVWIPYKQKVVSLKKIESEERAATRAHEVALAEAEAKARVICHGDCKHLE